jgi:predicted NAD-dependent protein-ADP-ribosyltransferase YbiA (DUF1768 family)
MNTDIKYFGKRVDFIVQDTDRILEVTRSSVLLPEFDLSIVLLNSYLGEMATLDRAMKQIMESRRDRRPITPEEEIADRAFAYKRSGVVDKLKKAVDIVEKRRRVIVKISENLSKKSNSKTEKLSPKVSSAKSSPKNATRKIVISASSEKIEKDINKTVVELQKEKVRMEKEREQQAKLLAKEREKQEKLLAKEREKQEKLLAKEREKLLAKEREKQEKQLAKEREQQEKQLAKEKEKLEKEREKMAKTQEKQEKLAVKEKAIATKKQAAPATNEQLLKDRVATFVFKKTEFQSLSNFWPCLITILEGENVYQYSSGEHAFHGEKYRRLAKHSTRTAELLDYSKQFLRCNDGGMSALDAKRKGGKSGFKLTEAELKLWDKLSLDVQREISMWKVNNIPQVRQDLLNTGNRILVHSAMRTSEKEMAKKYWEGKAIVNEHGEIVVLGGNWLGKIWMETRAKL